MIIHSSNLKRSVQASVINHGKLVVIGMGPCDNYFYNIFSIKTIIITINKITISVLSLLKCSLFQVMLFHFLFWLCRFQQSKKSYICKGGNIGIKMYRYPSGWKPFYTYGCNLHAVSFPGSWLLWPIHKMRRICRM